MAFRREGTFMTARALDPTTHRRQLEASAPDRSAWVSANAGSGKTHVLAQRVIRLLLAGADPSRLLCLTFTKAAAAEMAARVFNQLGEWVLMPDAELDGTLELLEGKRSTRETRARARRLFAMALETPGGLKIQTVHAFCERLLHQFPFEAGVAGHFQVLEETAARVLIGDARRKVLGRAAADLASPLGEALRRVVLTASDRSHEEAIAELIEDRSAFDRWIAAAGSLDNALAELRSAFGLDDVASPEEAEAMILGQTPFAHEELARLVAELRNTGGAQDGKAADRLAPYFYAPDHAGRLAAYRDFFCKADGGVRKASTLVTNKVRSAWPEIDERLTAECGRLEGLIETVNAAECYALSAAVLRLADAVLAAYQREKAIRGLLDFDDLIVRTLDLLSRSGAARWVHYKIDQGIDHILLDEAQDTSPGQWRVIRALADEFFAGEGGHERTRTLFAVGDEKQSIYSFQGAVPAWFSRVKRDIAARAGGAGQAFSDVELTVSFRSTPDIVGAVDAIFRPAAAHTGLSAEARAPVHEAIRRGEPGMVVVWPMEPQPEQPEPGEWAEPLDHIGESAPEAKLANRIATTIRSWLDSSAPARLESGKVIRPGEILVLTRRRGPLSEAINRALKASGVPVAGADRLALAEHIAAKDLIALGDVVLQDRDDLSLATLLKSPLFGLSEEALFALAYDRGPRSLWYAFKDASDAEPFSSPFRTLSALRARADAVGPFAFYAEVLGPGDGRRRFAERLGAEADDLLDEFLAQALAFERIETPSLQGFLDWMRSTATEIRRETDTAQNEIRVMTVHGAKGLEADIVFLVDDGSAPVSPGHDPNFLAITDDPDAAEPAPLVWARGSRKKPTLVRTLMDDHRERQKQEYRRLLYVGATRARDRLYVCGTFKDNATDRTGGWHALVSGALLPAAIETTAIDRTPAYVWQAPRMAQPVPGVAETEPAKAALQPEPSWLRKPVAAARAMRMIKPSQAIETPEYGDGRAAFAARREGTESALRRGRLVHRLLEALPEQPAAERRGIAARYLSAVAPDLDDDDRNKMIGEVVAILDDARFAAVFAPGSRAEIDIGGEIGEGDGRASLSGRIDRLAVTDHEVLIIDYKTNRPAPKSLESVSEVYLAQLALYARILGRLYPNRAVRSALLWTDVPALMEVPSERLARAESKAIGGRPGG
jgi:ATP-dependent helicase/nuclease subunit A